MTSQNIIQNAWVAGLAALTTLLVLYTLIVTSLSGWTLAEQQFSSTWYFIISLAVGFGLQVGLYSYLKQSLAQMQASGRVVAVSGTTSTTAMLACCAHYLANVAPLLGLAGVISLVAEYQQQLFWLGILFNLAGLTYLIYQLVKFKKTLSPD